MANVTAPSPESLSPPHPIAKPSPVSVIPPPAPETPSVATHTPSPPPPAPETPSVAAHTPSPPPPAPETPPVATPPNEDIKLPMPETTSIAPTPHGFTSPQKPDDVVKSPSGKSLSPSGNKGSTSSDSSHSHDSKSINVGVSVAGIVVIAMLIVCLLCSKKKKKRPYYDPKNGGYAGDNHVVQIPGHSTGSNEFSSGLSGNGYNFSNPLSPVGLGGLNTSSFTYEELEVATGGFSSTNMIGQGGFGYVYKGVLPNGKEVAVKSLKSGSGQGEREFQAEVEIISRVHHRYLVSLVGYCITNGQRMLVYDFVPNGTLEHHLHVKHQPTMEWLIRMRIALGSAKGLAYLHEDCHPRIIHRDIKSANILLDFNFEAMVADFGLAKLTTDNHTHVSTRVMGTFGYLAPEYASSGKLTDKSDVFSFGVMLLELITGRRPVDPTSRMEDSLVDWARPLLVKALEDGNYDDLVDPRLEGNFDRNEMARIAACASASIRHSARRRPKMSQVARALEGSSSLEDLIEVPKMQSGQQMASYGSSNRLIGEMNSSMYDTGAYNADMMRFRKMILTPDEDSKEYAGE